MEFNANTLIAKEMAKLALRYRKDWDNNKIVSIAKETSRVLKYVPSDRIQELFDEVYKSSKYFPEDKQFLDVWFKIKSRGTISGDYYDSWGTRVRDGAFYTVLSCPAAEWVLVASPAEKDLKIKFDLGILTSEEKEAWRKVCLKTWPVPQGPIQKPFDFWNGADKIFYQDWKAGYDSQIEDLNKRQEFFEKQN